MSEATTKRRMKSSETTIVAESIPEITDVTSETVSAVIGESVTDSTADAAVESDIKSIETDSDGSPEQLTSVSQEPTETVKKRAVKRNPKTKPMETAETAAPEFRAGEVVKTDLARVWPTSTSRQPIKPVAGEFYVQLDGAYDGRILIGQDAPAQNTKPIGWIDIAELRK